VYADRDQLLRSADEAKIPPDHREVPPHSKPASTIRTCKWSRAPLAGPEICDAIKAFSPDRFHIVVDLLLIATVTPFARAALTCSTANVSRDNVGDGEFDVIGLLTPPRHPWGQIPAKTDEAGVRPGEK